MTSQQMREDNKRAVGESTGCYQFFGIRSHLHHFYEYEDKPSDDAANYLLQPKKTKRFSPVLWKILLWFGINTLVFGAILILVGHFTPRQAILHPVLANGRYALVDRRAGRINLALDVLGTVGIISFCVAGVIIVVAVLLPTYFNEYCFEDRDIPSDDKESSYSGGYVSIPSEPPASPVERTVPATQLVESVQPARKGKQASVDTPYQPIE